MPLNIEELAELLTAEENKLLAELHGAKAARDLTLDHYGMMIVRCHKAGLSFGMMGHKLGVPREAVYRSLQRYLERTEQEYDSSRESE